MARAPRAPEPWRRGRGWRRARGAGDASWRCPPRGRRRGRHDPRGWRCNTPRAGRESIQCPHVHDLLGNLREWTATIPKPYPYQHDDGRESFTDAGRVVVRGASHDDPEDALSVTRRWSYDRRRAASGQHVGGVRGATSDELGEVGPGGRR